METKYDVELLDNVVEIPEYVNEMYYANAELLKKAKGDFQIYSDVLDDIGKEIENKARGLFDKFTVFGK